MPQLLTTAKRTLDLGTAGKSSSSAFIRLWVELLGFRSELRASKQNGDAGRFMSDRIALRPLRRAAVHYSVEKRPHDELSNPRQITNQTGP